MLLALLALGSPAIASSIEDDDGVGNMVMATLDRRGVRKMMSLVFAVYSMFDISGLQSRHRSPHLETRELLGTNHGVAMNACPALRDY